MFTSELNTITRDLKELRLMSEQLDAEIKTLEDAIKVHITEHGIAPSSPRKPPAEGSRFSKPHNA